MTEIIKATRADLDSLPVLMLESYIIYRRTRHTPAWRLGLRHFKEYGYRPAVVIQTPDHWLVPVEPPYIEVEK